MGRREQVNKKDNLIFFPGVETRYLEEGMAHIQAKNFAEAMQLFENGLEVDPDNRELNVGLALAYFETGKLQQAKEQLKQMLTNQLGDYLELMDMYIMILVQLGEYEEVTTIIEVLLEEGNIPSSQLEHFSKMLDFSRRMENAPSQRVEKEDEQEIDFSTINEQNEQIQVASMLSKSNIARHMEQILQYLQAEEGNLFFKTLLLNVLQEHHYNESVLVRKVGRELHVVPVELPSFPHITEMQKLIVELENELSHEDPVSYEIVVEMVKRHYFYLYPFTSEADVDALAAAYHAIVYLYQGRDIRKEEIAQRYNASFEKYESAVEVVRWLEEISSVKI